MTRRRIDEPFPVVPSLWLSTSIIRMRRESNCDEEREEFLTEKNGCSVHRCTNVLFFLFFFFFFAKPINTHQIRERPSRSDGNLFEIASVRRPVISHRHNPEEWAGRGILLINFAPIKGNDFFSQKENDNASEAETLWKCHYFATCLNIKEMNRTESRKPRMTKRTRLRSEDLEASVERPREPNAPMRFKKHGVMAFHSVKRYRRVSASINRSRDYQVHRPFLSDTIWIEARDGRSAGSLSRYLNLQQPTTARRRSAVSSRRQVSRSPD